MDGPDCGQVAKKETAQVKLISRAERQADNLHWEKGDGILRVLYLFSGVKRKSDLANWLKSMASQYTQVKDIIVDEVELEASEFPQDIVGYLRARQVYKPVTTTSSSAPPPCSSFTRIVWTNTAGPRRVRPAHILSVTRGPTPQRRLEPRKVTLTSSSSSRSFRN